MTIDLAPVIDQVKQRLVNNGVTAAAKIPQVNTSITVAQAKNINKYRTLFRLLQIAGVWLPFVTLGLAGLGILLARDRRHATVVAFLGIFVTAALVGILSASSGPSTSVRCPRTSRRRRPKRCTTRSSGS